MKHGFFDYLRHYRGNIVKFNRHYPELACPLSVWKYFPRWYQSFREAETFPGKRVPWITLPALEFLGRQIKGGEQVFEYGMGGSTLFWMDKGCRVVSVEHDPEWYEKVQRLIADNPIVRTKLIPAEQPNESKYGMTRFQSEFSVWAGYDFEAYVRSAESIGEASIDIGMVDGRARVAAMQTLAPKIKPGGILILDNSERERYLPVHGWMKNLGWQANHFPGPVAGRINFFSCTSFWRKPE